LNSQAFYSGFLNGLKKIDFLMIVYIHKKTKSAFTNYWFTILRNFFRKKRSPLSIDKGLSFLKRRKPSLSACRTCFSFRFCFYYSLFCGYRFCCRRFVTSLFHWWCTCFICRRLFPRVGNCFFQVINNSF